ncbi:MAG TPA: tryptophan synthase subunit alpha [Candidatus Baltobacteraceae bacterium]|nr:tryptophan synthase subunit alpha [Candidatus Baltobacteraceae bacterium]
MLNLSKGAVIPYVMAGDPDIETTKAVLRALADAGAAAIELGVPYGDPLADGPTIAAAGVRALANGVGLIETLALLRETAEALPPVILFTYYNPIYQYGIENFARDAKAAGAAGVIVPDVALEESAHLREALAANGLQMPLLVAPSTPLDRAKRIAGLSSGFVYVVSRLGVTGAGSTPDFSPLIAQLEQLRTVTDKPLAVGFGISKREHAETVAPYADAVIVGSALIDAYSNGPQENSAARAGAFLRTLTGR